MVRQRTASAPRRRPAGSGLERAGEGRPWRAGHPCRGNAARTRPGELAAVLELLVPERIDSGTTMTLCSLTSWSVRSQALSVTYGRGHARVCHGGGATQEGARRAAAAWRRTPAPADRILPAVTMRRAGSNRSNRSNGRTVGRPADGPGVRCDRPDGRRRRCASWRRPSQITTAPKVSPPARTEPTTRVSSPVTLVDEERLDTTRTRFPWARRR